MITDPDTMLWIAIGAAVAYTVYVSVAVWRCQSWSRPRRWFWILFGILLAPLGSAIVQVLLAAERRAKPKPTGRQTG